MPKNDDEREGAASCFQDERSRTPVQAWIKSIRGAKQNIPHGAEKDTPTWDHSPIIPFGTTTIDMEHEIFFLDLPKDKKQ